MAAARVRLPAPHAVLASRASGAEAGSSHHFPFAREISLASFPDNTKSHLVCCAGLAPLLKSLRLRIRRNLASIFLSSVRKLFRLTIYCLLPSPTSRFLCSRSFLVRCFLLSLSRIRFASLSVAASFSPNPSSARASPTPNLF